MRVVIDANVLARAVFRVDGPAAEVVNKVTEFPHTLILSPFIVQELRRVLRYPRLQRLHGFNEAEIDELVDGLEASSIVITLREEDVISVVPSDPNDDPIVATAVSGTADVLCTLDKHFHHREVITYCKGHGIRVMSDIELLELLRAESSSE